MNENCLSSSKQKAKKTISTDTSTNWTLSRCFSVVHSKSLRQWRNLLDFRWNFLLCLSAWFHWKNVWRWLTGCWKKFQHSINSISVADDFVIDTVVSSSELLSDSSDPNTNEVNFEQARPCTQSVKQEQTTTPLTKIGLISIPIIAIVIVVSFEYGFWFHATFLTSKFYVVHSSQSTERKCHGSIDDYCGHYSVIKVNQITKTTVIG